MKISNSSDLSNIAADDLPKYVSSILGQVSTILNAGINFQDNFNAQRVSVTFSAANTETVVRHNLGRVPIGYLPLTLSAAMILYNGSTANDDATLYLKSSATGTAMVLIF